MRNLSAYIQALADNIPHAEKINPSVSSSSVGWHVQHCLMIVNGVSNQLKKSDPLLYKYNFNKIKTIVFLMNKIPRGKGKSPSVVNPVEIFSQPQLLQMIQSTLNTIEELKTLHKHTNFMHPYFGMLNLRSTLKFLNIHTNHHLKIIKDIVHP